MVDFLLETQEYLLPACDASIARATGCVLSREGYGSVPPLGNNVCIDRMQRKIREVDSIHMALLEGVSPIARLRSQNYTKYLVI